MEKLKSPITWNTRQEPLRKAGAVSYESKPVHGFMQMWIRQTQYEMNSIETGDSKSTKPKETAIVVIFPDSTKIVLEKSDRTNPTLQIQREITDNIPGERFMRLRRSHDSGEQ